MSEEPDAVSDLEEAFRGWMVEAIENKEVWERADLAYRLNEMHQAFAAGALYASKKSLATVKALNKEPDHA